MRLAASGWFAGWPRAWRPVAIAVLAFSLAGVGAASAQPDTIFSGPTPRAQCGPGARPETGRQGRVPQSDIDSGRAALGYQCNFEQLAHFGQRGGYKVERYVDPAGHECAYYDTTLLFPKDAIQADGVYVLDMTDPAHPVQTDTLLAPPMLTPHESMLVNQKRGLLVAVSANPAFYPGLVAVYDLTADCRHPVPKSSLPTGVLGHESGFAPDGNTFYSSSLDAGFITAIDMADPVLTKPIWIDHTIGRIHGLSIRDDGRRAYLATRAGLIILDTSQIQDRAPNPTAPQVGQTLTWPTMSTPQITIPVTIGGHAFLVEIDEFGGGTDHIGAARVIDIADEVHPRVVSNIRLEVNMKENQAEQAAANDPGQGTIFRGYAGHYCAVPSRVEPGVLACTFILSGLRLFDIRDPYNPRELAYFNPPPRKLIPGAPTADDPIANYAMSKAAFVPERKEVWYSDGNNGFYALRFTNLEVPFGREPRGAPPKAPAVVPSTSLTAPSTSTAPPAGYLALALVSFSLALLLGLALRRRPARP